VAQFDPTVLKQLAETMRQSGAIDCLARPDWAGVLRGRSQYVQAVAVAIADLGLPVGQEDFETTRSSLGEGEWDEATQRSYCRR
jgi:predicted NAD/FAD-binding protein